VILPIFPHISYLRPAKAPQMGTEVPGPALSKHYPVVQNNQHSIATTREPLCGLKHKLASLDHFDKSSLILGIYITMSHLNIQASFEVDIVSSVHRWHDQGPWGISLPQATQSTVEPIWEVLSPKPIHCCSCHGWEGLCPSAGGGAHLLLDN
jgi:hypothetical protein